MRAFTFVLLSTAALAACDAPDPSSFRHALRSDVMTGTHINGTVATGEIDASDQHDMEQVQRRGDISHQGR